MLTIENLKSKIPSLSSISDDNLQHVLGQAKSKTLALRAILKLSVIFVSGFLYLLAKAYLLDKGYSRIVSIFGSVFIIAFAFLLVNRIDEKILIATIKKNL